MWWEPAGGTGPHSGRTNSFRPCRHGIGLQPTCCVAWVVDALGPQGVAKPPVLWLIPFPLALGQHLARLHAALQQQSDQRTGWVWGHASRPLPDAALPRQQVLSRLGHPWATSPAAHSALTHPRLPVLACPPRQSALLADLPSSPALTLASLPSSPCTGSPLPYGLPGSQTWPPGSAPRHRQP